MAAAPRFHEQLGLEVEYTSGPNGEGVIGADLEGNLGQMGGRGGILRKQGRSVCDREKATEEVPCQGIPYTH